MQTFQLCVFLKKDNFGGGEVEQNPLISSLFFLLYPHCVSTLYIFSVVHEERVFVDDVKKKKEGRFKKNLCFNVKSQIFSRRLEGVICYTAMYV